MVKHVRIKDGHSVKEWETKFKKQIEKKKIKVFDKESELLDYATYWKINDKYYQAPTIFEWYEKSLRKSKGLTIALTCTSTLATFFLLATLIQSQIKWTKDTYGVSVSFYAVDGTFSDGTKSKVVSGITKGTKLKNISGYSSCIPSLDDYKFIHWHLDDGKQKETDFSEDDPINQNLSLKAYYELNPREPNRFGGISHLDECDSWETVMSVIRKGKDVFIKTYCKDQLAEYGDEEQALLHFMDDNEYNYRTISVGDVNDYGVRLIGVGQDHLYNSQEKEDHELFTFEFNECVMPLPYSFSQGGSPFYRKDGSESVELHDYCALKTYTDDIIFNQLPSIIKENVKTVTKRTLQVEGGFKYKYVDNLQSWQFDKRCLNGTYEDEKGIKYPNKVQIVDTPETLFSLSLDEIGATKYDFDYTLSVDPDTGEPTKTMPGRPLMEETTQYTCDQIEDASGSSILNSRGEGFLVNDGNYTGSYQFYSHEWYNPYDHTDHQKRMKRYFVGDGEDSVNTYYRLRSIYIPNDKDEDNEFGATGNKDYRPFESWNIMDDGTIGNLKHNAAEKDEDVEYFACGDMAWVSAFVAPAFCL